MNFQKKWRAMALAEIREAGGTLTVGPAGHSWLIRAWSRLVDEGAVEVVSENLATGEKTYRLKQ